MHLHTVNYVIIQLTPKVVLFLENRITTQHLNEMELTIFEFKKKNDLLYSFNN